VIKNTYELGMVFDKNIYEFDMVFAYMIWISMVFEIFFEFDKNKHNGY
jgi:hypothetical protein